MLTVYAAWTEGAPDHDIRAIRARAIRKGWKAIRHSEATAAPVNDTSRSIPQPPHWIRHWRGL
jgi:hypothetical protein